MKLVAVSKKTVFSRLMSGVFKAGYCNILKRYGRGGIQILLHSNSNINLSFELQLFGRLNFGL